MARKATINIPFADLKKICATKGINSWPTYQKRFKEIPGAKKTLHASYAKEWKGNKAFFGNAETVERPAAKKPATSKKTSVKKTASNASKKTGSKKVAKKVEAKS